jgi:hypothetical protein
MRRIKQMVQTMHKYIGGELAVGHKFALRSGAEYEVQDNGSVIRTRWKPWNNKAEMKRYHKERRDVLFGAADKVGGEGR